jgi:hypothetical protein
VTRDLLSYAPTVLVWAAVAYRLPAVRRAPGDAGQRWNWLTLLCLALALTVLLPPVYLWLGPALAVLNVARLLGNGLVLVASWTVQSYLFHLNYPPEEARPGVRRAGFVLVAALAAMTVLFVLAPVDQDVVDFTGRYGDAPYVLEYRLVFLAYLALALYKVIRLSWRYAGVAGRPALALGLRLVALGAALGLGYVAHEGLRVAARRLGSGDPIPASDPLTRLLVAGSVGLMVVGSTMPAWGPRVGLPGLWRWAGRYRAHRRLYPLWRDLVRATPDIALLPPRSPLADALTVRDLGFRLYRRVIEIRDGALALRPHLDPALAEQARAACHAAGLSDDATRAVVEAACPAAALDARRRHEAANPTSPTLGSAGGADLATEVALLERVARCYRRSPIVRAVLAGRRQHRPAASSPAARLTR